MSMDPARRRELPGSGATWTEPGTIACWCSATWCQWRVAGGLRMVRNRE